MADRAETTDRAACVAFDYERQTWVSGEAARRLLVEQLEDTLAILESPGGADYVRMTQRRGETVTLAEAIATVRANLATCRVGRKS